MAANLDGDVLWMARWVLIVVDDKILNLATTVADKVLNLKSTVADKVPNLKSTVADKLWIPYGT